MIWKVILGGVTGVVIVMSFSGCTDHERRGYSSIPQNRPADWEARPYGSLAN